MNKEDRLHIEIVRYVSLQYPKARLHHSPNGGSRNPIEGAKFKRMGVSRGFPDLIFPDRMGGFNGMALELKIKPNKPTKEQNEWLNHFTSIGWITGVCYDFEQAKVYIDAYYK